MKAISRNRSCWPAIALALIFALPPAPAAGRQDAELIRQAVESYLRTHAASRGGEASFVIGTIDAGNRLSPCAALEASLPAGARAWGRTAVLVQCHSAPGWSLYVPVQVTVQGEYLVAARSLAQGQVVAEEDLIVQRGDLAQLPAGVLSDVGEAVGHTAAVSILAGRPLRSGMLRRALAVRQGQSVKLVTRGAGFSVSVEGKALANAAEGQFVQARTASGRTLAGIAREGSVIEVGH
jgi:flagella basal body P-ring formation protein FlgA